LQRSSFIVACAETNEDDSAALAERIENATEKILNASLRRATASFSKQALIFEELAQKAKEKL
jgi:GGDEF domain-containing protein